MGEITVSKEYRVSIAEVLDILNYLPENMVSKIPEKFMQFLREHSVLDYKPEFDYSKGLDKIPLSNKTRALLAMIYRDYICSEEERAEYDKILHQNEEKYQSELREKYNPDNMFKKENKIEKKEKNMQLVEYKEPKWYKRIFQRILSIFK